jgi:acetate kinase
MSESALRVLCLNAGSSSLKFALWSLSPAAHGGESKLVEGAAEAIGAGDARLWFKAGVGGRERTERPLPDIAAACEAVFELWQQHAWPEPNALGHRVVHGGATYAAPTHIDAELLSNLRELVPLAPLHLPGALAALDAARARYAELPQVACFDTAFHQRMPELARRLPLPRALWDKGVRRYGFHGLSFEYVLQHLGEAASGRVIIAHLGNGASLAAVSGGVPRDTSMGFSPTSGVMMGTRTGDLDPGLIVYLLTEQGYDVRALEHLVNRESGLLGVSGSTADVKTLLERRASDPRAAEALALFCYHVQKQIGAYAAALGGIDTLVFTGGIGERAAFVRATVSAPLAFLGVQLDGAANERGAEHIGRAGSTCSVRVVATDEDLMIARHTRDLLAAAT